ncbi:MAG: penicillin-binding protein 1C [Elusimicrobiaceae bacterium]|nr:penicillin-binding protein 1C [Elusimicrobiaceae bacterium]
MKARLWTVLFWLLPCLVSGGEVPFLSASVQMADRNGAPMRGFLSSNNTYYYPVSLGEISPWFIAAVVAAEDKRFYYHHGVDVQAVLRAFFQNARKGEVVSGASTITQQLVRAIEPRPKTFWGKTSEAWQAVKWEQTHSKEEILEAYFNYIELGNLTQGVQAAAQFYFGVDAAEVSLSQAAFLVGIAKSPTRYNPLKHFARTLKRRDYVLERMRTEKLIDEEMYRLSKEEPVVLRVPQRPFEAPHFTRFLHQLLPPGTSYVRTTLDKDLQVYAEKLVKNHLQKLHDKHVTQAAVIVLENSTGAVLAYVGSADYYKNPDGQVDGVRALRQPGSSVKPFVYGLAFEKGLLTPATLLQDEDTFFEGGFRPRNYDENFHGEVPARNALACSYNIPAVKVAEKLGAPAILQLLRSAGLTELTRPADFYGLGLALGNGEVQLLHLANAYAALARGGLYKPIVVSFEPFIALPGGQKQILSPQSAYLVSDILSDNQARAAAFGLNSPLSVPFELAAKTGTSKDYKDNFTLAYTPRWTIGVWAGNFDATSMRQISGVTGAGPIMHDLAVYLQQNYPSPPFEQPEGVVRAAVCKQSGLLAGPSCTHKQEEVFLKQYLPEVCSGNHTRVVPKTAILSPTDKDVYQWDSAVASGLQKVRFEATCAAEVCTWILDGKKQPKTSCRHWWPLQVGKHVLQVSCGNETDSVSFEVLP